MNAIKFPYSSLFRKWAGGLFACIRCAAFIPGIISIILPPGGFMVVLALATPRAYCAAPVPQADISDFKEPEPLPIKPPPPAPTEFFPSDNQKVKPHGGRISLRHLDLSRSPSEEELIQCGQLGSPLSPTHSANPKKIKDARLRKVQEDDNLLFGTAMQKWNEHHYGEAVQLFHNHRQTYPNSPWAGEAQLHLGCQAQFSGDWDGAKYSFEWILGNLEKGSDIWQKAKLRRAVLHFEQGELDSASNMFGEMLMTETSWERKTYAQNWLLRINQLKGHQAAVRICGRDSIAHVLEMRGDKSGAEKAKETIAPGERGFSLGELQRFAWEMNLPATAIKADAIGLESLGTPFVAHYKDEHFVTVTGVESDAVNIFDSRLGRVTQLTREQFANQWSGLALVFVKIPANARLASGTELEQEIGGCCGVPRPESDLGDPCKTQCTTCSASPGRGLPEWDVNPVNMNLVVSDIPIWQDNPVGPNLEIRLTYNSQDALNQYRPFGNKWSFNYASYAMESPASTVTGTTYSQGTILIIMPDGRRDVYSPLQSYTSGQIGTYTSPVGIFNKLEKIGDYDFRLTDQDGTVYRYGVPPAMSGGSASSLLLSITDRNGFALVLTYDVNGQIQTISDSLGHTFTFEYNTDGTVSRISDTFGRQALFSYTNGNLTGQTDMGGLSYSYSYDSNVYLTSIGKPSGTWLFYIEPADHIDNGSNPYPSPGGVMWENYRITITNPIGYKEEYHFNGYSKYAWHRDANQYLSSLPALSAPKTKYSYTTVNGQGVVARIDYADGSYTSLDNFDGNRLPKTITDGNNHTEYRSYNTQGAVVSATNARGYVSTYEYEDYGNGNSGVDLKKVTKAGHILTTVTHYTDSSSPAYRKVNSVTDAIGRAISFTYNSFGQIQTRTLPDSTVQTFWYKNDGSHLLEKITQGEGNQIVQSYTYDSIGRIASVTNQNGFTRAFSYDGLNRPVRTTYPDGTFDETQWGCCTVERKTDRNGQSTRFLNNRANQLIFKWEPNGTTTRFRYDPAGNLVQLIDGQNNPTRWTYTAGNRISQKIYADLTNVAYAYDNAGNLTTLTDTYQRATQYTYDNNNNLVDVISLGTPAGITPAYPADVAQVHFTYDELDRRKTMTDGIALSTWTYDDASQITGIIVAGGSNAWTDTMSYGYDSFGRNTSRTVNGTSISSQFDAAGRMTLMTTPAGTYTYSYADALTTNVSSIAYPNGQVTTFGYYPDTGDLRLQTIWNKDGASTISKFDYQYHPVGQVTQWQRQAGGNPATSYEFGYDTNSQLISAVLSQSGTAQLRYGYGYDAAGNRLNEAIDSSVTRNDHNQLNQITQRTSGGAIPIRGTSSKTLSSVTVNGKAAAIASGTNFSGLAQVTTGTNTVTVVAMDQSNPILSSTNQYAVTVVNGTANTTALSYDLNGNLVSDGTRTFEWDSRNRLTAVNQGTHRAEFAYDGLNRRVKVVEKENGTTQSSKRLVWAGLEIVEERDGSTNALNKGYNNLEMTIATDSSAGTYFYTRDHLGSVREITDASKTVRARYDYDPYGRRTKISGDIDVDFGYTGHYTHVATGLILAPYRAYDSELGRWLSRDPIGEQGGLNLYQYANNSPVLYVDPDGKNALIVGVAVATAGALYFLYTVNHDLKDFKEGMEKRNEGMCKLRNGDRSGMKDVADGSDQAAKGLNKAAGTMTQKALNPASYVAPGTNLGNTPALP